MKPKIHMFGNSQDVLSSWERISTPPARPMSKKQRQKNPQGVVVTYIPRGAPWSSGRIVQDANGLRKSKQFGTVYVTDNSVLFSDLCMKFIENGGLKGVPYSFASYKPNGLLDWSAKLDEMSWMQPGDILKRIPHH